MSTAIVAAETAPGAPSAIPARPGRICPECGGSFLPPISGPGQHKQFCCPEHRIAFANREKAQGSVVVTIAKVWRKARGSGDQGKRAFQEMTAILDQLLEQDRKAGRQLPKSYVDSILRDPYLDRRRR